VRRLIWILMFGVLFSACAGHVPPNAEPESKIAIYASDVMKGTREVQRITIALETGKVITESQAERIMGIALKIGQGGEKLSTGLSLYHSTKDLIQKKLALQEIYATLDQMDNDLKLLLTPLDPGGTKLQYIDTVVEIIKSILSIKAMLPAMGSI
jgi:hypothetical protein